MLLFAKLKVVSAACILTVFSCAQSSGPRSNDDTMNDSVHHSSNDQRKDYFMLKRIRIIDQYGMSEPVEAFSFLLPSTWKTTGGIKWNLTKCLSDIIQFSFKASSPDGKFELIILPTTQFDWVNNEQMMYALRTGGFGSGCQIGQPIDAAGYIQRILPALVGARPGNASPIRGMEEQLKRQASQFSAPGYVIQPSAAEGTMYFNDGSEGLAICSIGQIIQTIPGYDGSIISHFQTTVHTRMVLKYPKGSDKAARNILGTLQSSLRVNNVWGQAIATMFNNIRAVVQDETWKRIQISRQLQNEISNNITRSWEKKNESTDKTSEWFSQYIRGVDSWSGDNGAKVELTSGYSNAWEKGDGSYLLSNDPTFDPNKEFQESWKRLSK